jgi:DNA (cytosine-5)-methyltransferase 1
MKYFELFAGVGGFRLAIENYYANKTNKWTVPTLSSERNMPNGDSRLGGESEQRSICVGYSEIDKYAISVYDYQFPNTTNYGDITKIQWNTVPDFDLVVGGSPCQDLSVAGKQKGLSGARSGLFFEFVRCLKEKQPTNFIWENVKGALSSSSGWDFARVQIEFSEAGYDCEWQVLNAKDFGVPQNRERIFVVGHLREKSQPKVFPITSNNRKTLEGIIAVDRGELKPRTITNALDANYYKGIDNHQARTGVISQVNQPTHSNDRVYSEDGISPSLNTMQGGRRQPKVIRTPLKFLQRNQKNIEGDYAFTVDSANTGGIKEGTRIRRLTPMECSRLMSWPDTWLDKGLVNGKEVEISDSQKYKMAGNGVVSKVVEAIIERL